MVVMRTRVVVRAAGVVRTAMSAVAVTAGAAMCVALVAVLVLVVRSGVNVAVIVVAVLANVVVMAVPRLGAVRMSRLVVFRDRPPRDGRRAVVDVLPARVVWLSGFDRVRSQQWGDRARPLGMAHVAARHVDHISGLTRRVRRREGSTHGLSHPRSEGVEFSLLGTLPREKLISFQCPLMPKVSAVRVGLGPSRGQDPGELIKQMVGPGDPDPRRVQRLVDIQLREQGDPLLGEQLAPSQQPPHLLRHGFAP